MIELIYWLLLFTRIAALAYLILMLAYLAGWQRLSDYVPLKKSNHPFLSIIVAMRNEASNLRQLMQALANQTYPAHKLQIVLSDDGSDDDSASLARTLVLELGMPNVLVVENQAAGKKSALQSAFRHARGEWLLFTDADCVPHPEWAETMLAEAIHRDKLMVLGPVKIGRTTSLIEKFQAAETNSLMAATAGSAGIGVPSMANGANMLISSKVLNEGDSHALKPQYASGDDMFRLEAILKRYGSKAIGMAMHPGAMVVTMPAPDMALFFRQRMRWVSKSGGYSRPELIVPALIVFLFNALLAFTLLLSTIFPVLLLAFVALVVLKTLTDLPLVWPAFRLAGQKNLLAWFVVFQLVYPVYVFVTGLAGMMVSVRWKGRG
ncbi:MAG: glycosyltransferase [Bacteroidetes bacterium]|nr:glycosyltransferase [Bacteroidota bacterium]